MQKAETPSQPCQAIHWKTCSLKAGMDLATHPTPMWFPTCNFYNSLAKGKKKSAPRIQADVLYQKMNNYTCKIWGRSLCTSARLSKLLLHGCCGISISFLEVLLCNSCSSFSSSKFVSGGK